MRSIWSGAITLSLINIPVHLGSTTKDNGLSLRLVRQSDGSRIKYPTIAEADGREVQWNEIGKGYDAPDGSLVVLSQDEVKKVHGPKNRVAEILMFTEAASIPPLAVKSSYWVEPDTGGAKTYALLAGALQDTGKVAVLTFSMREKEAVAVLRAHDGYLALETLEWDANMTRPDFPAPAQTASAADQSLALKLIADMSGKYDHAAQANRSDDAVMEIIQKRIEAGQVIKAPANPDAPHRGMPANLTASLQAAVDAQRAKTAPVPAKPRATRARKAA
jgi:DNA end-binding protein Ku